jgi:hypothetical protein
MNQSQVALLNEIEQRQSSIHVTPRDLDHEPEIALDHALTRSMITATGEARVMHFLLRGQ